MLLLLLAVGFAAFFYFALIRPFQYWASIGVPQASIGTLWLTNVKAILQLKAPPDILRSVYDSFPDLRYGGSYRFIAPTLFLRDPDLIKQITVKDFDHFVDHHQVIPEEVEPLWGKSLFALKGEKWREMRATVSPSFTSSKMRAMFGLMTECADRFVRHFQNGSSSTVTVEFKDAFTRFANDIIASTAFGITCDSLKDREIEFYLMGKEAMNFRGFWKNMKFMLMFISPQLTKVLGIQLFNKQVRGFFRRLVKTNMESREKNGIIRPDIIHLLMEARKGRLKHEENTNGVVDTGFAVIEESSVGKDEKRQKSQLTDDDITAQALIFFFAGFDSVSTLMCFAVYELAVNTDVQVRLQKEVDETLRKCEGTLTYEGLLNMKYLDMVLRKWPAITAVDRVCDKPYTIQPTRKGEKPVHLKKGDIVWLPIFGLHRDPAFYPNPDRFDPERFSDENKGSIRPYSYIPFGSGPRGCIANRFALLEVKSVLFYLLSKFNLAVVEKSPIPMKLAKNAKSMAAEGGFWFGLKPRTVIK